MTVFVYVNTSKQVGDPEHIKLLRMPMPRKPGSRRTIRKALRSHRQPDGLRHARDPGAGDGLAGARIALAIASQRLESKRAALARPLAGQICSE